MRNKKAIIGMSAMATLAYGGTTLVEDLEESDKRNPGPQKEPTPFKKQDGIKKLISEYNLIQQGKSKKGRLKQNRVVEKINYYLKHGFLTKEDLTQKTPDQTSTGGE